MSETTKLSTLFVGASQMIDYYTLIEKVYTFHTLTLDKHRCALSYALRWWKGRRVPWNHLLASLYSSVWCFFLGRSFPDEKDYFITYPSSNK
ncbi:MAG: hypothetical protein ACFB0B_07085 [Thermonemataceae bacterium]